MVNKGIFNYNVCGNHNKKCSDEFESYISNELKYLFKHLEIKPKSKSSHQYNSTFIIDGIHCNTKFDEVKNLFDGRCFSGEKDGQKYLFGPVDKLQKAKKINFSTLKLLEGEVHITKKNSSSFYSIIYSNEMLRLVSKIAYEWYCKVNSINEYKDIYKDIVDFIIEGYKKEYDLVEVVTDKTFCDEIIDDFGLGSYAISITTLQNGQIYVLFSFLGLVIYKIYIKYCSFELHGVNSRTPFYVVSFDGIDYIKETNQFNPCDIDSTEAEEGISILKDYILLNHEKLLNTSIATLKSLKRRVDNISDIMNSNKDKTKLYFKLIGIHDSKQLSTIYILKQLADNENIINYENSFDDMLIQIMKTEDYRLNSTDLSNELKQDYDNEILLRSIKKGMEIFYKFYNKNK